MKELINIQTELKAPKNQYNKFGGYNYRNAEDILEALKPHLASNKCYLIITDEPVVIEGWHYIKATATLFSSTGEFVQTSAYAREEESRKGMDASQITGSTSSYARKYALNGLFCIDDTKDSDTLNTQTKDQKKAPAVVPAPTPTPATPKAQPQTAKEFLKPSDRQESGASTQNSNVASQGQSVNEESLGDIIEKIKKSTSGKELTEIYNKYKETYRGERAFIDTLRECSAKLKNQGIK